MSSISKRSCCQNKKKKFDLIEERNDLFCPECESLIVPKTVGFYLCKFKIYGKKLEDGQEQEFSNESDEASNKDTLKYFDPELSGNVMITQLIFEVEKYLWLWNRLIELNNYI